VYAEPPRSVEGLPTPGRCLVVGVVNVTPDSFSDGGRWLDPEQAIARARRLLADGADIVDVGGESTRPRAARVDAEEELRRVLPVVAGIAATGAVVSVDTTRAVVAEAALAAGASLVNDVSGGQADPAMLALVAEAAVPYVCMHWRGPSARMDDLAAYTDVVADVRDELLRQVEAVLAAGVAPGRVAVDPGLGFAKLGADNWRLLGRLEVLHELGFPILLGASRKRFLGALAADSGGGQPPSAPARDAATAAVSTLAAAAGAWGVRVHDVASSRQAVAVVSRWAAAGAHTDGGGRSAPDRLALRGLAGWGRHGVLAAERRDGQRFLVDVVLGVDSRAAAASDDLADTVDYAALATKITAVIEGDPVQLIETLAQRLADLCLAEDRVQEVEVSVHKPDAPIPVTFGDVELSIRRSRP
jgi:dihydropteroate synthase